MNPLYLDTLTAKTQRFLSVVVCECWWPCRQDYERRTCWNGPNSWVEWNCACPSVCDNDC